MDDAELDELDHQVAAALGGVLDGDGWRFETPLADGSTFMKTKHSFCREWSYGGPLIEREGIWLESGGNPRLWRARHGDFGAPMAWAKTPLVAAMRALVAVRNNSN